MVKQSACFTVYLRWIEEGNHDAQRADIVQVLIQTPNLTNSLINTTPTCAGGADQWNNLVYFLNENPHAQASVAHDCPMAAYLQ